MLLINTSRHFREFYMSDGLNQEGKFKEITSFLDYAMKQMMLCKRKTTLFIWGKHGIGKRNGYIAKVALALCCVLLLNSKKWVIYRIPEIFDPTQMIQ